MEPVTELIQRAQWRYQLTYVPQLGQHFPEITQTVCPFAAQLEHLRAGTLQRLACVRPIGG